MSKTINNNVVLDFKILFRSSIFRNMYSYLKLYKVCQERRQKWLNKEYRLEVIRKKKRNFLFFKKEHTFYTLWKLSCFLDFQNFLWSLKNFVISLDFVYFLAHLNFIKNAPKTGQKETRSKQLKKLRNFHFAFETSPVLKSTANVINNN